MVYYRKYRPQKLDDLDEERVRDTLKAVLLSKKSNFHAFLFTGPKGLGKTSAARIVAKFLNCEARKAGDPEPCNRCYQCTSITNGSNLDIFEIDAASNRGIDEIRDLREKINLSTIKAKYKVYIIDEVHMLTTEAFNALLKTLEEPPSHAVFVLCTTDPQKVPATIVSRCLHVPFSLATSEELIRSLKRIVKGEGLKVGDGVLSMIADLSDGSFRDGSKILQEVSAKAGNKTISQDFFLENYKNVAVGLSLSGLLSCLEEKNAKKALDLVNKIVADGVDMKYLSEELIKRIHQELLSKLDGKGDLKFSLEELKKLLELLMGSSSQVKYAVLPQLPLELAIVEYCSLGSPTMLQDDARPQVSLSETRLPEFKENRKQVPQSVLNSPANGQASSFLQELILKVNLENKMIAGVLRGVVLSQMDGKKVTLETKSKFHKDKLLENKVRDLIEKISSEILKKSVRIDVQLKGGEGK